VEGDDDDDDLWDGWGEEAPTQDATHSLTKSESPSNHDIHNLSVLKTLDQEKKGEIEYKSESKYEKNNNKKSSKNGKEGDGGVEKGTGSACKPVSSRAQQQQKRKEMKALKFEREKAKRLETIMIKAQKLQLYEEEKKARNQKVLEKKKEEEEIAEKEETLIVEKETNGGQEKIEVKGGEIGEKLEKIGTSSSASAGVVDTPLNITKAPLNEETVEEIKIEVKKEEEVEKEKAEVKEEEEKEAQKKNAVAVETQATTAAAATGTKTTTAPAVVVNGVVQVGGVEVEKDAVKDVVKGELSDGHASPEYGDSDGMEEEDEEEDVDHEVEVEVEVGAKNVPLPSAEEDDDDALLKRRTLGQGFLRDIMAEYDRDRPTNKNLKPCLNGGVDGGVDEGTQAQSNSLKTSQTSALPPSSSPSSPSAIIIATITAADLGSDPRLSELLGALSASQQSCLKLWSPKKVSENAYTKVSVCSHVHW
jgi:hypothetical protein